MGLKINAILTQTVGISKILVTLSILTDVSKIFERCVHMQMSIYSVKNNEGLEKITVLNTASYLC